MILETLSYNANLILASLWHPYDSHKPVSRIPKSLKVIHFQIFLVKHFMLASRIIFIDDIVNSALDVPCVWRR